MTLEKLTREEMLHELRQFDKVAREYGWSEEGVNCLPWTFLDDELKKLFFRVSRMVQREARVRAVLGEWMLQKVSLAAAEELRQALDPEEERPPAPAPPPEEPQRPAAHILTRGLGTDIPPPKRRG